LQSSETLPLDTGQGELIRIVGARLRRWLFLWLFSTLVHHELVPQILLRACAVAPKVGWSKELVLAFRTTSHNGNFAVVPQDDEAALWHDEDSVAHSQEMRHPATGASEESWRDA
jgi:hypothetical protein